METVKSLWNATNSAGNINCIELCHISQMKISQAQIDI